MAPCSSITDPLSYMFGKVKGAPVPVMFMRKMLPVIAAVLAMEPSGQYFISSTVGQLEWRDRMRHGGNTVKLTAVVFSSTDWITPTWF